MTRPAYQHRRLNTKIYHDPDLSECDTIDDKDRRRTIVMEFQAGGEMDGVEFVKEFFSYEYRANSKIGPYI